MKEAAARPETCLKAKVSAYAQPSPTSRGRAFNSSPRAVGGGQEGGPARTLPKTKAAPKQGRFSFSGRETSFGRQATPTLRSSSRFLLEEVG